MDAMAAMSLLRHLDGIVTGTALVIASDVHHQPSVGPRLVWKESVLQPLLLPLLQSRSSNPLSAVLGLCRISLRLMMSVYECLSRMS